MPVVFRNNATTTLASAITASATSIALKTGDGAKFPAPTGGDWFPVTLIKADNTNEVVRCTARSGDVLTVVRAQEGTSGKIFSAGDRVELRLTNAAIAEFMQQSSFSAFIKTLIDDASAEAARNTLGLPLTTSSTDGTAGRVTKVGDFGLGGLNAQISSTDLNALNKTGFYMGSALTNSPSGVGWYYVIHQEHGATGYSSQIAIELAGSAEKIYARKKIGGTFTGWREIALTDSPAFTGTPTSPTAAAGTNSAQLANTAFVKAAVDAAVDFTIIYPNGGSAGSPANVTTNTRYIESNPFAGHHVLCVAELLIDGEWGDPNWVMDTSLAGRGTKAAALGSSIIVQTGRNNVCSAFGYRAGHPFGGIADISTAPCRVKVWKVKGAIA